MYLMNPNSTRIDKTSIAKKTHQNGRNNERENEREIKAFHKRRSAFIPSTLRWFQIAWLSIKVFDRTPKNAH